MGGGGGGASAADGYLISSVLIGGGGGGFCWDAWVGEEASSTGMSNIVPIFTSPCPPYNAPSLTFLSHTHTCPTVTYGYLNDNSLGTLSNLPPHANPRLKNIKKSKPMSVFLVNSKSVSIFFCGKS